MMGRNIQMTMPALQLGLQPKWPNLDIISENDMVAKESNNEKCNVSNTRPPVKHQNQ